MEKLITTVACDARMSCPIGSDCRPQEDPPWGARRGVDGLKAGAAIAHVHGRRTLEETMQPRVRQVYRIHDADWKKLMDMIKAEAGPVVRH